MVSLEHDCAGTSMAEHTPGQTGCDDRLLQSSPGPAVQTQPLQMAMDRNHRNTDNENYDMQNLPGQLQEEHHHVKPHDEPSSRPQHTSCAPQMAPTAASDEDSAPVTGQSSQATTPKIGRVPGANPHAI